MVVVIKAENDRLLGRATSSANEALFDIFLSFSFYHLVFKIF